MRQILLKWSLTVNNYQINKKRKSARYSLKKTVTEPNRTYSSSLNLTQQQPVTFLIEANLW